ncbi:MAG TPA: PepSY-associated TM helix domain-containing protein [Chitinophagaceae bacterium]
MKKGFVFTIHSIAGLLAGLFILLMSLSGALLVFHDELDSLQYPSIITEGNKEIISIDSAYRSLQKQYPHAQISNCHLSRQASAPFIFFVYEPSFREGKEAMQVFIHPQTGMVLKTKGSRDGFMSWVDTLHGSLHLGKKGEWLLGFFALVFLLSLVTGIILYRKNLVAVLTFRKTVFRKGNLHQLIGVYALLFNLLIGITGLWMQRYVFKKDFYRAYNYTPVLKASPSLFYSIDSSFEKLKEKYPAFTGHVIYFAQSKKGKTAVYGSQSSNSFIHSKKYADAISLDSAGNIASTRFVNEISSADRYDIINSQIHYGKYGGWPVKLIYCLFGLTGGLLSITGFLLWVKRKK